MRAKDIEKTMSNDEIYLQIDMIFEKQLKLDASAKQVQCNDTQTMSELNRNKITQQTDLIRTPNNGHLKRECKYIDSIKHRKSRTEINNKTNETTRFWHRIETCDRFAR